MESEIKIGDRLTELMTLRNINNKTLAATINVSQATVCRWKKHAKYMSLSQIVKLAEFFRCSLDFLTGRSDTVIDFQPQDRPPFYDHFRKLLQDKNISRYQINKETTIKSSHFTDWKKGSDPHIISLIELADYLNVTLDYLVGRER